MYISHLARAVSTHFLESYPLIVNIVWRSFCTRVCSAESGGSSKAAAIPEVPVNPLPAVGEATERVTTAFPTIALAGFTSAKWQDKV